jgi:uncharacterized protein
LAYEGSHSVTDTAQRGPATVVVMQPVKRGHDQEVRRWQEAVNDAVSAFAGYLGNAFAPGNDGEWTVIYRFDSKPHLMDWLASPERAEVLRRGVHLFEGPATQLIRENDAEVVTIAVSHPVDPADQLLREGERFKEFELHRISSPFGSWFAQPGGDEEQDGPPNWKTGLSVLVGLYPTVVVLTLAISEIWPKGPLWAALLVGNICSVSLLTWVVMPVVTRALRFWLVPGRQVSSARLDFIGAAASVGFLTIAALVFWLCTTQIWHLP